MNFGARCRQVGAGATLVMAAAWAAAQEPVALRRPFELPPSADLSYTLEAKQKGFSFGGSGTVAWRAAGGKYSVAGAWKASFLGKILENRSEGALDAYGLAPTRFFEKRFRKESTAANFDRAARIIGFDGDNTTYSILGGEQDRSSVQWQLAAIGRASPDKFVRGSEWKFFVVGRRDAEVWTFKVLNRESIKTAIGSMQTVHLVKTSQADSTAQRVDLWLAPAHEWYPVKLRISEDEGEYIEQTITRIDKRGQIAR